MKHRGIIVVVSGFSGAGKGTLMKELLKTYDNYALSITEYDSGKGSMDEDATSRAVLIRVIV